MGDGQTVAWSSVTSWRTECIDRFGTIEELPIRSPGDQLKRLLQPGLDVLDIGAGPGGWRAPVQDAGAVYSSMDVDPGGLFDYKTFSDVPVMRAFDLMVANQLLEHLTIPEGRDLLLEAQGRLRPGGHFLATVPNMHHPVRYWGDATHVTAWPYGDLYGLFRSTGFDVLQVFRYGKRSFPRNPLRAWLLRVVCEELRLDWCDSLLLLAQRPKPPHSGERQASAR